MGMNVGSGGGGEPEVMMDINTTPLIDVMLVLIIMLIITIPIQTHAVKLNMPIGKPPPQVVQIDIDFDGTLIWNGETLSGRPELDARLKQASTQAEQPELHLRPNKLVKYRNVAMVLASAQRLGLTKVGIIGHEQFVR